MEKLEQALLENHLAFLAAHRGSVRRGGDILAIESDRAEFSYSILGERARIGQLPRDVQTVQLLPTASITSDDLQAAAFAPTFGLSYMVLGSDLPVWRWRHDVVVTSVQDAAQMGIFSEVQSRGFNEEEAGFERWHPWLNAANQRNLGAPDQIFYLGRLAGKAVATALTVFSGDTAGIYAVATLAEHRRQGVSTTLLKKAVNDALARGAAVVTLQVRQDSTVEDFYRRLGFRRVFTTAMFRRQL